MKIFLNVTRETFTSSRRYRPLASVKRFAGWRRPFSSTNRVSVSVTFIPPRLLPLVDRLGRGMSESTYTDGRPNMEITSTLLPDARLV